MVCSACGWRPSTPPLRPRRRRQHRSAHRRPGMPDVWWRFRPRGARRRRCSTSRGWSQSGCRTQLAPPVLAAYDAPFPAQESRRARGRCRPSSRPARRTRPPAPTAGMVGAVALDAAVPARLQRRRSDHARDGPRAGTVDAGGGGPSAPDDRGRRALPPGRRGPCPRRRGGRVRAGDLTGAPRSPRSARNHRLRDPKEDRSAGRPGRRLRSGNCGGQRPTAPVPQRRGGEAPPANQASRRLRRPGATGGAR